MELQIGLGFQFILILLCTASFFGDELDGFYSRMGTRSLKYSDLRKPMQLKEHISQLLAPILHGSGLRVFETFRKQHSQSKCVLSY